MSHPPKPTVMTASRNHLARKLCIAFLLLVLNHFNMFAQDNTYQVYALKFAATNNKLPLSKIAVGASSADSVQICYMIWLLKGKNGKNILVDTGFPDSTKMGNFLYKFSRPDLMLEKVNLKASDITDVILTHTHWDHIGGIDLFPNAMVWLQQDDYNYLVGTAWQKDGNPFGLRKNHALKTVQKNIDGKLTLVKGDNIEIIPGIKVFIGSKHTYESQFVLVNTGSDQVIIASDNSWYYYNLVHLIPIPLTFDTKAYLENLKRMKAMVKNIDLIIPGHDPLVFTKFPTVAEDVVKIRD
jgi:glyoxylase-like metal-dependent hydrolase (beta-lactamase superfamily II)